MALLIPNRQEVDEVFNLRHTIGRKTSNLLDQGLFGHGGLGSIVAQAFTLAEARRFGGAREQSGSNWLTLGTLVRLLSRLIARLSTFAEVHATALGGVIDVRVDIARAWTIASIAAFGTTNPGDKRS